MRKVRFLLKSFSNKLGYLRLNNIKKVLFSLIPFIGRFVGGLFRLKTYHSKIIILRTSCLHGYRDNTKYLYEYLSLNTSYLVYWVTENDKIKKYLTDNGMKYISRSSLIRYLSISSNSSVVIDTGSHFHNPLNVVSDNAIKICTYHGSGPKTTLVNYADLESNLSEIYNINEFDYINFPSQFTINISAKQIFRIPSNKIISFGYPRCDNFFNIDFVRKRSKNKPIFNNLKKLLHVKASGFYLYTPTWRPYDYRLPILALEGYSNELFNEYLKSIDKCLFYTTHTAKSPKDILPRMSNIIFLDIDSYYLLDINELMIEADMLINDYSTTSVEFGILGKPQLFIMPDFEKYNNEKGFVDDYLKIIPGPYVKNYAKLIDYLTVFSVDPSAYPDLYKERTKLFVNRYYEFCDGKSSERFSGFIQNMLNGGNK